MKELPYNDWTPDELLVEYWKSPEKQNNPNLSLKKFNKDFEKHNMTNRPNLFWKKYNEALQSN